MPRLSILFLVVCAGCLLEKAVGFNYYIQTGGASPSLLTYPLIAPLSAIWGPDCDKKGGESSSSSESGSSESGEKSSGESGEKAEGSSESSGEEKKESKESGESKEESKGEESGSKEEGEGKKEGSSEESGEKKKEGSEESGEKKKEEKKKKKYVFPTRTYDFPPSKVQQIMYSPVSSYSYIPYRTSYVVQQPVAPYPVKSSYRYVSVPSTAGYSAPVVSRLVNSPITKIVYSSGLNYPQVSKSVVSPGAAIYSVPGSWNSGVSYYKK